jgi:hypothetical protein
MPKQIKVYKSPRKLNFFEQCGLKLAFMDPLSPKLRDMAKATGSYSIYCCPHCHLWHRAAKGKKII